MPSFQSVVLTDRASTPVNRTFTPHSDDNGVNVVVWSPDGTISSASKLSISRRTVNGKLKTRMLFAVPVVQTETINGVAKPVVIRESYVDATFTFSTSSSEAERADVVGMFASALASNKVLINDTLVKGEAIWG